MSVKLEVVSLKKHPTLTEKWVQDQIADDPSILGIGELELKDWERIQAGTGRLDLLLYDPDTLAVRGRALTTLVKQARQRFSKGG